MLSTLTFATLTFASMVFAAGPLAVVAPVPGPQLDVFPPAITLLGMDDAIQMVVSLPLANGRLSDRTRESKFQAVDPSLLRVTPAGRVIPLKNGSTTLRITDGALFREVAVKIQGCEAPIPIHFANQIVPIFTKLGCNSGGCHGKASGQNGFKISLLGYEPDVDYIAIVKEGRGRRVFPAAPEASLLLTKATGQSPHGGGKRLEMDSDEYKLLRRWIASGIPVGEATEPVVKRIQIVPEQRVLSRDSTQQFAVLAHYTNGRIEDITRRAQYESNETTIATVDPAGLVATHKIPGEAAIMARYQEYVTVFRATVPRSETPVDFTFPQQTLVDKHTAAKWKSLALTPSALSTDEQFLRRVSIDLTGTLPDPKRVSEFLADTRPNKRQVIVDELLDSAEFGYLFASKWADILRVKRSGDTNRAQGTFSFHGWIRQAMQDDMPFDQFSRAVISATGDEKSNPPALWTKSITQPEQFVDDTAQVFLGQRLACAQCHHHPYEKWSQDDYWSLAAFFGRIGRKEITLPGEYLGQPVKTTLVVTNPSGSVANKRKNTTP